MPGKTITPAPAPPLTNELILRILDYVYHADVHIDRSPDYKTLMAASLVSSDWAPPAQSLLFRHVRITHKYRAHAFLRVAGQKNEKSRMLREAVRILEVSFKDPLRNKKLKISNDELVYLVQSCPYLYELDILENPAQIQPDQADFLRAAAPVRALRMQLVTDVDRMLELIAVWPSLQHLEVLPPKPFTPEPTLESAKEFKLRELRLQVSYDPEATLATHIAPALRQLDILALTRGALRPTALKTLLASVSGTLRSLTLELWDDAAARAANACPALQELTLWSGVFRTTSATGSLVDTLPRTIVHFAFYLHGLLDAGRLQRERATIEGVTKRVPNLRVVTCYNYLGERERSWATPFVRYCRSKGIRIREFPTGGGDAPVDLVPTRGFPRRLTTANFALMAPLPPVVQRQQLLDYTSPPTASSSRMTGGSRKRLASFASKLFGGRSAPEEKYEKLE
ncbi:hypothetical protein EXIGLDRAFT_760497 [Exidia glandulosa HHB12029]|uniref:F-box domain-containing protein n=1 Tax=Exidia glandulosa HHB12029 TaxID=1314781 RepID=A0A165PAR3_EXIGL|nr:hypothetical protein EXIGLDRAFT_760497 [Exidia glandulosa HHB12029]